MKYCTKCGKELHDEAVICPNCGCAVNTQTNNFDNTPQNTRLNEFENNAKIGFILSIIGIASSFFIPIVGLVCAIISRVMCSKIKLETIAICSQSETEKIDTVRGRLKISNILNIITIVLFVAAIILGIIAAIFAGSLLAGFLYY